MARTISGLSVRDIRTPTSRTLAGSDAMHTDPDYSATYVVLTTDARDNLEGHGMTFTLGRGNTDADVDRLLEVLPPIEKAASKS